MWFDETMPSQDTERTGDYELLAAFASTGEAKDALSALSAIPVKASIITVPGTGQADEAGEPSSTITGALLGAIWGMLLAAIFINFLAVNPGLIMTAGATFFGTLGGMAVGGLIAGAIAGQETHTGRRSVAANPDSAAAFVSVQGGAAQDIQRAYTLLKMGNAIDVFQP